MQCNFFIRGLFYKRIVVQDKSDVIRLAAWELKDMSVVTNLNSLFNEHYFEFFRDGIESNRFECTDKDAFMLMEYECGFRVADKIDFWDIVSDTDMMRVFDVLNKWREFDGEVDCE